ncbi:MAG: Bacterial dnaA protein helix-turn-helix [Candidatus Parcubacteria bacterium]|jgi:hypothetical protein
MSGKSPLFLIPRWSGYVELVSRDTELELLPVDTIRDVPDACDLVMRGVARAWCVDIHLFVATGRCKQYIADARMVAMSIAYRWEIGSTTTVGEKFNRDHTSVVHAVKKLQSIVTKSVHHRQNYLNSLKYIADLYLELKPDETRT